MPDIDELSPEISGPLVDLLLRTVLAVTGGPNDPYSARAETVDTHIASIRCAVDRQIASIHRCVQETLSAGLVSRNALAPAIHRLPDEVLTLTWSYLPLKNLALINRVCRKWRSAALESPALWSHLAIHDSVHRPGCPCFGCSSEDRRAGFNNYAYIEQVLPRSKAAPLRIEVDIELSYPCLEDWSLLCGMLSGHTDRIREIRFHVQNHQVVQHFFDHCVRFPTLRVLSVTSDSDNGIWCPNGALSMAEYFIGGDTTRFPTLQRLELHPNYALDSRAVCFTLRSLCCSVLRIEDIRPFLLSASRLEYLHLILLDPQVPALQDDVNLLRRIDGIPHLRVSNIPQDLQGQAPCSFAHSRRKRLELSYDGPIQLSIHPPVYHHLEGCFDLVITQVEQPYYCEIDVAFADRAGHSVLVQFPPDGDREPGQDLIYDGIVWPNMPDSLVSLTVDALAWDVVIPDILQAPKLTNLTVRIGEAVHLEKITRRGLDDTYSFKAPIAISSDSPVCIPPALLERIKQALGVEHISLSGVFIDNAS